MRCGQCARALDRYPNNPHTTHPEQSVSSGPPPHPRTTISNAGSWVGGRGVTLCASGVPVPVPDATPRCGVGVDGADVCVCSAGAGAEGLGPAAAAAAATAAVDGLAAVPAVPVMPEPAGPLPMRCGSGRGLVGKDARLAVGAMAWMGVDMVGCTTVQERGGERDAGGGMQNGKQGRMREPNTHSMSLTQHCRSHAQPGRVCNHPPHPTDSSPPPSPGTAGATCPSQSCACTYPLPPLWQVTRYPLSSSLSSSAAVRCFSGPPGTDVDGGWGAPFLVPQTRGKYRRAVGVSGCSLCFFQLWPGGQVARYTVRCCFSAVERFSERDQVLLARTSSRRSDALTHMLRPVATGHRSHRTHHNKRSVHRISH